MRKLPFSVSYFGSWAFSITMISFSTSQPLIGATAEAMTHWAAVPEDILSVLFFHPVGTSGGGRLTVTFQVCAEYSNYLTCHRRHEGNLIWRTPFAFSLCFRIDGKTLDL
jgi:hypothetical protein